MSVRLNFWVVEGLLLDKQYAQMVYDMEEQLELEGLEIVSCDPMSNSDFILGKVLYRYTEEKEGKAALVHDTWYKDIQLHVKLIGVSNKLGVQPDVKIYALTELS